MKNKFTESQQQVIDNCSNTYLKLIYMIDFLFINNNQKKKWCEVLNETTKTKNLKVKIMYLYLTYITNTKKHTNDISIEFPEFIEKELLKPQYEEDTDVNLELKSLNVVNAKQKGIDINVVIPTKNLIDYNLKHIRKIKVKYDNFKSKNRKDNRI